MDVLTFYHAVHTTIHVIRLSHRALSLHIFNCISMIAKIKFGLPNRKQEKHISLYSLIKMIPANNGFKKLVR